MNFGATRFEQAFFGDAPKRNLFWKRRKERLRAINDQADVEEIEAEVETECETDEDCDEGCQCSEEGECECEDEDEDEDLRPLAAQDYSEDQPRDEGGKFTDGSGGAGSSSSSSGETHPAHPRLYQRVASGTGEPKEMVEVVPLTKELFDTHVAHMTSADPTAIPRVDTPSTFEKAAGKGFKEAAFVVTKRGTRVFWMLGKRGFTPPGTRSMESAK